ncbi:MAG: EAL domain-containing protein [bacterium]|nr:EAL domain-containing protein [bacterium]
MKLLLAIVYALIMICLTVCIIRATRSEKKISRHIIGVLGSSIVTVGASFVQILTYHELVADIAYSIYFASIDWLVLMLAWFANEYCGYYFNKKELTVTAILVCGMDSVSLILNPLWGHAYHLYSIDRNGELFWGYTGLWPFNIHLIISYILVIGYALILIRKIYESTEIYRVRYSSILLITMAVVVVDAIAVFSGQLIDPMVICFPIAAIVLYYYSMEHVPKMLVSNTLAMMVDELQDGVIIADIDGNAIYANDCVKTMLHLDALRAEEFPDRFDDWCRRHYQTRDQEFIYDWTVLPEEGGEKQYLKVKYQYLRDSKGVFQGSYLTIQNRTEEVNTLLEERFAANHDHLTGLYNREYFYEQVQHCLRVHSNERYLMICSDIRDFKMVNDVFGTQAADQLLKDIAQALREQTIPGEIYGRLVNDRFALFMKKRDFREVKFIDGPAEVMKIAKDVSFPLQVYVGVYEITEPDIPVSVMCDRAFMAIDTIKGDYNKHVAYYDEQLRRTMLNEQLLLADFEQAILDEDFEMYIQPQVYADGRCIGGEALVRWNHPLRGMLMPGAFIGLFEQNGMIVQLDRYIWEHACRQLREWKAEGYPERYISVNISPKDFFFADVYKEITQLVEKYEISPANLKLEITETAMMTELPKQLELIEKLRKAGFIVEMDDFGSGYSSLNMLKDIRVDVLKIDMAFLRKSDDEIRSRSILKTIINLAKQLNMQVITEGVETQEHADFLRTAGCDIFQGYYYAKPMPVEAFEQQFLKK